MDVYVRGADGKWLQFERIVNTVATEDIDRTLVYRFMRPVYNWWKDMGVYQRDLTGFDVSPVLHGRSFGDGCINCHSFAGRLPANESIAPERIKVLVSSIDAAVRMQKSAKDSNVRSFRDSRIDSVVLSERLFTCTNPRRIASPSAR